MDWIEIICSLPSRKALETVTHIFDKHFPDGSVLHDPQTILKHVEGNDWDAHEFSEDILREDALKISGYLQNDKQLDTKVAALKEEVEKALAVFSEVPGWESKVIPDEDWSESWKEHYHVLHYGKRIQVVPEWLEPDYPEDIVIRIEPGMAFGTGEHETTSLCMAWLEELVEDGMTVFDVGTGSGILAIAARALGGERVDAMDFDPIAVVAAAKNAAKNNSTIMIYQSDLLKGCVGQADLIIANIVADVILKLVPDLGAHLNENGKFLCSGVLIERQKDVVQALENTGFSILEIREDGEWCAILAQMRKA